MEFKHKSVLLGETLDLLQPKKNGVYVDGTIGGAGHSAELMRLMASSNRVCCADVSGTSSSSSSSSGMNSGWSVPRPRTC